MYIYGTSCSGRVLILESSRSKSMNNLLAQLAKKVLKKNIYLDLKRIRAYFNLHITNEQVVV